MKYTAALLALASTALSNPLPQGVTESISPEASAPAGCKPDVDGTFNIQVVNVTSSSAKVKRQQDGILTMTLKGGVLMDQAGRTGYIAANYQFQFDDPPQTGAIYTAGFSLCENGSLAIGDEAVWKQCYSGGFYNLYSEDVTSGQCNEIYIEAINGGGSSGGSTGAATQASDGQPAETGAVTQKSDGQPQETPVSQISDGQPQAATGAPVSQISDGQPQAPTGNPVSQISDGQPQAPTGNPVSQISDGQPQAPTGAPVSQISDGQPQAPTGAPVSQISDGQPQAPTGTPVSQISDGQPQAPTGAPVSQISDGQPQAPTGSPVSQISDGQVQAATGSPSAYTGGMPRPTASLSGLVAAGFVGVVAML